MTFAYPCNHMPPWMVIWFCITAIICTSDASFIVFRPHTLPGGIAHNLFFFYKYYIYTDRRYNDMQDSYVLTQSLMNYVEVILNIVVLYCHCRRSIYTRIIAFTVSVMTFWKTVLYIAMFYELAGGKDYRSGNTIQDEILLVLIPNGIWILLPALCILCLWAHLMNSQRESTSAYKLKES